MVHVINIKKEKKMTSCTYLDGCHKIRKFSSEWAHNPKSKFKMINNRNKKNVFWYVHAVWNFKKIKLSNLNK